MSDGAEQLRTEEPAIGNSINSLDADLKKRKSIVRVRVTYLATGFVFIGSILLIIWCLICKQFDIAKDLFLTVLPVATGVITYWFADRSRGKKPEGD